MTKTKKKKTKCNIICFGTLFCIQICTMDYILKLRRSFSKIMRLRQNIKYVYFSNEFLSLNLFSLIGGEEVYTLCKRFLIKLKSFAFL